MSYADKIMEDLSSEQQNVQPETTVEVKPAEETPAETTASEQPTEMPEETPTDKPEETQAEDKPAEDKPFSEQRSDWLDGKDKKKDPSQFSKEEQAEFAFRKQLAKQKAKYEQGLSDLRKDLDDIKEAIRPKQVKKTRADFDPETEGDDEYIRYLTKQGVDEALAAREAESAKRAKEAEEAAELQRKFAANFNENCHRCFEGQAYNGFSEKVQLATDNGLAEMLDEVPTVRNYLFTNPNGPIVLNEMLSDKNAFIRVMSKSSDPIESALELHEMAKEIISRGREQQSAPAPAQPKPMPNIGKPGSTRGPSAPTMWDNDKALIDFVRKHR